MKPFYRATLRDYLPLKSRIRLADFAEQYTEEIVADLRANEPKYYPFCEYGTSVRTNQGIYLTRVTPALYQLLLQAANSESISIPEAAAGLFIPLAEFKSLLALLTTRKNLILQGPPGVGKTLVAEHLAWALLGERNRSRLGFVQFHQSYSYEDFVQGYRPTAAGGFERRDGLFARFCEAARNDPGRPYVFLIDEINRGNISKIFGELLMLLEVDRRDRPIALTYHTALDAAFAIPGNVHVIGMMNTADRSLAVVDYALRRRFAFYQLTSQIGSDAFKTHLQSQGVSAEIVERITTRVAALNKVIAEDRQQLGPDYEIGHSFFCSFDGAESAAEWYRRIVDSELLPLLREYWFEDPEKAALHADRLRK